MNKMIFAACRAYAERYMSPKEKQLFLAVIKDMILLDYFKSNEDKS